MQQSFNMSKVEIYRNLNNEKKYNYPSFFRERLKNDKNVSLFNYVNLSAFCFFTIVLLNFVIVLPRDFMLNLVFLKRLVHR